MLRFVFTLLSCFLFGISFSKDVAKPVRTQYGFIENKGQIIDQHNHPNPAVKYLWNGGGLNVQLKANSFSYEVVKRKPNGKYTAKSRRHPGLDPGSPEGLQSARHSRWDPATPPVPNGTFGRAVSSIQYPASSIQPPASRILISRVDVELLGANPSPQILAQGASNNYINYYTTGTPEEGVTPVRHFSKVLYKNIYPHIDLEFLADSSSEHGFKYNFIVRPGGLVSDIRLRYKGAGKTTLDKNGDLIITTAYGEFSESIPLSYEEGGKPVTVSYKKLAVDTYGLEAASYDQTKTLMIDPWATYYGGNSYDDSWCVVADAANNVIVTGYTNSINAIATSGSFQANFGSAGDAFIVKFSVSGVRLWATYYGGGAGDGGSGLAIDGNGDIMFCGSTESTTNIATSGAFQTILTGAFDGILAKFNTAGTRLWSTYFGGTGSERATRVSVNSTGIFVSGWTDSYDSIATAGTYQPVYAGNADAFVMKFDLTGNRIWGTYFGGADWEDCLRNVVDSDGNLIVIGTTTSSTGIATPSSHQQVYGGYYDAYIAKFDSLGNLLWSTYYGGASEDYGFSVDVDDFMNIYFGGLTESLSGISTVGAHQFSLGGGDDGFIAKFSKNGARIWGTYYGGAGYEELYGLNVGHFGEVVVAGYTESLNNIATPGVVQQTFGGYLDATIAKFDTQGVLQWGTYYGGGGLDGGNDVVVDATGNVICCGFSQSLSGIATGGSHQQVLGGMNDAFIVVLTSAGTFTPLSVIGNNIINAQQASCAGILPGQIASSTPTGGTGTYQYLWLQSTTNSNSGFTAASGTNNLQNYQPPALTTNTWYKRVVLSGSATDTSAAVMITVNPAPAATATAAGSLTFCQGGNVALNANSGTGLSYQWLLNNGIITGAATDFYIAAQSGDYSVIVTNANNCSDTSGSINVTVISLPTAVITPQGPTTFCQGENVQLDANTGSGLSYQWLLNNTVVAGATNISYNAGIAGDYSVAVTNSNNCSDTSAAVTVGVNALPFAPVSPGGSLSICQGNTIVLQTNSGPGLSYQWMLNNQPIPGANDDTLMTGNSGGYSVIVTNAANCSDTSVNVIVNALPIPPAIITFAGNDTICQGDTVLLEGTPIVGLLFQWQLNGADISGATDMNYAATVSGSYTLVVQAGCDSTSPLVSITVLPLPVPLITHTGMSLSTGSFAAYQWSQNGVPIPTATSQSLNLSANGTYSVTVTDSNGCEGTSADVVITDVGVNDQHQAILQVSPNPTSGEVRISSANWLEGKIRLSDAAGRLLFTADVRGNYIPLDLSPYASGAYLLEYAARDGARAKVKIVRE